MIGPVAWHPDPDQFAALSAGAVDKRDREDLLRHMSECGACRECFFVLSRSASTPEAHRSVFANWTATLAIAAALAAAGCWFVPYPWSPNINHEPASALEQTGGSKRVFENVTLVSASKLRSAPRPWVLVRFFDGTPQRNQILLRTPHGERLITLATPLK